MTRWWWLPLLLFAGFVGLAAYQMSQPRDETVHSRMIGQPLPYFELEPALETLPGASSKAFADGKPRLLNIWASWCLPCIAEAPQLAALKAQGVEIVGIAIRDRPEDVAAFLQQHGNPYSAIGRDDLSAVQFELGSSGVPETFLIDGKGVIRHQVIGELHDYDVPMLLEKLKEVQR